MAALILWLRELHEWLVLNCSPLPDASAMQRSDYKVARLEMNFS